jgi:hypothetical protein
LRVWSPNPEIQGRYPSLGGEMPYRVKGTTVQVKKDDRWVDMKTYSGSNAKKKAEKYAARLNIEYARSKGHHIPEKK